MCAKGKCHIVGTKKCSVDGLECICKTNFKGIYCDTCQKGHFGASCQSKYLLSMNITLGFVVGVEYCVANTTHTFKMF